MAIEEWREEIQKMDHALAIATGRIKATGDNSELREIRQHEANIINWRLLAFQLAEPHLDALYREHSAAKAYESRYSARSQNDTVHWAKTAAWCAVLGVLTLLVGRWLDLSGWVTLVGVLLLVGTALSAAYALLAHGDLPDTSVSMGLKSRIHEVETLCKCCQDTDDYKAVKSLLDRLSRPVTPGPAPSGSAVVRTR